MGKYTRAELTPFRFMLHHVTPHIWTPLIKSFHLSIHMWGVTCDLCVDVTSLAPLTTQVPQGESNAAREGQRGLVCL